MICCLISCRQSSCCASPALLRIPSLSKQFMAGKHGAGGCCRFESFFGSPAGLVASLLALRFGRFGRLGVYWFVSIFIVEHPCSGLMVDPGHPRMARLPFLNIHGRPGPSMDPAIPYLHDYPSYDRVPMREPPSPYTPLGGGANPHCHIVRPK